MTCTKNIGNEDGFFYLEAWETYEQLERHMRSARYERLLAIMEASAQPPQLRGAVRITFTEATVPDGRGGVSKKKAMLGYMFKKHFGIPLGVIFFFGQRYTLSSHSWSNGMRRR